MGAHSFMAIAAIAGIAACTDSPVAPRQAELSPNLRDLSQLGTARQIAPLQLFRPMAIGPGLRGVPFVSDDAHGNGDDPPPPPQIKYWHGGLITTQKLAAIYYSPTPVYRNGPRPGRADSGEEDGSLVG